MTTQNEVVLPHYMNNYTILLQLPDNIRHILPLYGDLLASAHVGRAVNNDQLIVVAVAQLISVKFSVLISQQ